MSSREVLTGRCHCSGVTFEVRASSRSVTFCHCTDCRRTTGHFHAAVGIKEKNLLFNNQETLQWYASSEDVQRGFCNNCGSNLFWKRHGMQPPYISIQAGMFDEPNDLTGERHIFVEEKGTYYSLDDDLPKVDRW